MRAPSRRGDYVAARKNIQPAIPVFSGPDAEPYQKHKLAELLAEIDKHPAPGKMMAAANDRAPTLPG